jgi:hypothetical protein
MSGIKGIFTSGPAIQTLGLPAPPVGPEKSGEWYHEALQLPETRVTGWFGCALGSEQSDHDVQLLFHNGDHLEPTVRLVIKADDLMRVFAGIGNLLHTRLGLLKEWELREIPPDAA